VNAILAVNENAFDSVVTQTDMRASLSVSGGADVKNCGRLPRVSATSLPSASN
jgi:hypothetical protein